MVQTIHSQTVMSARKEYRCNACECLDYNDALSMHGITEAEKQDLEKAKENGWKIKKSEPYIRQFNGDGGDTWTYRAIPAIHKICIKYDIYDN